MNQRILVVLLGVAGCAGDRPAGSPAAPGPGPVVVDLAPCGFLDPAPLAIDVSEQADLFHDGAFGRIGARLQDGPNPGFHQVTAEEGACRYLEHHIGTCDPLCAAPEVCTADDTCVAFPGSASGGTLTVSGLGAPIELEAADFAPGTYYGPSGLPGDLFASGDPIGAALSGGQVPALALGALGVAAMDQELVETGFEMRDGEDAVLTWTPDDPQACVAVVLNGSNATHGAPLDDVIVCEGPDTGSLVVPRPLVEAFPLGETPEVTEGYDWPHSTVTRYTRSRTDTPLGPAELTVRSTTSFLLGHTAR